MDFKAGSLVKTRGRDWIVMPSNNEDLVLLKPLGGSEEEITGIYLPLAFESDRLESTNFPKVTADDIGDISSARLLYNACRLSFRSGAGPFRSLAKLSFRPRAYQMVPLIMALRQPGPVRLLIADDVGVGKTVEALLVLKELLERREIKRFAIIVLPHLCEQWQAELKDKFGIEAVIIRSNTQARLDREIHGDTSVFEYYPYQIISIDYIKSDHRRPVFVQECPEFIIVDEIHTCTRPEGASVSQQQRYRLIHDLAAKEGQHMVYLTATPHSGKPAQFQSLLGLIHPDYGNMDLIEASQTDRRRLARYYVQRRRADVEKWMNEDTPFPVREAGEFQYDLSPNYDIFYSEMLDFALGLTKREDSRAGVRRLRYWSALALLRGVMSSPAAGIEMLKNRLTKAAEELPEEENGEDNPILDEDYSTARDFTPTAILERTNWTSTEQRKLTELATKLSGLQGVGLDHKALKTVQIVKQWLKEGYHPVIFCRFIATANYLGSVLQLELGGSKGLDIQVVTSEDPDEIRKSRIDSMPHTSKRVLVATDCLSEGINLQEKFTAVLHYDLPWNPNRLEQREGRVDRFGQREKKVKTFLLYGANNPIDGVVLKVLLRKVREIRRSTGITIPFPEDSRSLMDSVMQAVLESPQARLKPKYQQLTLFDTVSMVHEKELAASNAIEKAAQREKASRSIFAQNAIKAEEIEQDLHEADQAIGNPEAVEKFVAESLRKLLGVQVTENRRHGYNLFTDNLPPVLKSFLPQERQLPISFFSPTPEGYFYLGRNHPFVEQLCQLLMANSLAHRHDYGPARAAIVRCREVMLKTTILLFRVRNVIEAKQGGNQLVAEEMLIWGYEGSIEDNRRLDPDQAQKLLYEVLPSADLSPQARASFLADELTEVEAAHAAGFMDEVALARAEILLEAHERFRKLLGGTEYKVVEPVLPMDMMGVYLLLPENRA
jgi:superfamily II DNA or RNA helicase